jgi:hypothetical protein
MRKSPVIREKMLARDQPHKRGSAEPMISQPAAHPGFRERLSTSN